MEVESLFFADKDTLSFASLPHKQGYAEDIEEGKFSYPIVLYLNDPSTTKKDQLLNILKQRTRDVELKKYAVKILDESGFLEKVRLSFKSSLFVRTPSKY